MTEKQIVVANQLVNYLTNDIADPSAGAVVFLHGWRSDARVWKPIIERLLRDYARNDNILNFYALDLPGFGKSEKPKRDFNLDNYAAVVMGLIKKLQLENVALVGHSFGGRVAIKLSVLEPDLIHKLILVDSAGYRLNKSRNALLRVVAKLFKPFFMVFGLKMLRFRIYRAIGADDYLATPELKQTFLNVINEDLTALLQYIRQETLIVWGGRDEDTPLVLAMWLKEHIGRSDLVIFHDAGHFSFLDEPDKFVEAVKDFLKG